LPNILPHQSVRFHSGVMAKEIPALYTPDQIKGPHPKRPLQFIVDWSAKTRVLTLDVQWVRQTRRGDGTPFARHAFECRTI
jgi:hypothetical protein